MNKERQQDNTNWRLAVNIAYNWRRMMGVPEVNYPYPGEPDKDLNIYAA